MCRQTLLFIVIAKGAIWHKIAQNRLPLSTATVQYNAYILHVTDSLYCCRRLASAEHYAYDVIEMCLHCTGSATYEVTDPEP